jgi:hypothetical protein
MCINSKQWDEWQLVVKSEENVTWIPLPAPELEAVRLEILANAKGKKRDKETMKFKCPCGSHYYQIFRTTEIWNGTYVSDDAFPNTESEIVWPMNEFDNDEKWTVQCEFCNKTWGPASSFKRIAGILKRESVLK